jgi:hypothetical protein
VHGPPSESMSTLPFGRLRVNPSVDSGYSLRAWTAAFLGLRSEFSAGRLGPNELSNVSETSQ